MKRIIAILLGIFIAFFSNAMASEKKPTKQETLQFIKGLVAPSVNAGGVVQPDPMAYFLKIGTDPCNPILESNLGSVQSFFTMPMKLVAPNGIEITTMSGDVEGISIRYILNLHSVDGEKAFYEDTRINGKPFIQGNKAALVVPVRDGSEINAKKMAKAIAHLATLCGAKSDLF